MRLRQFTPRSRIGSTIPTDGPGRWVSTTVSGALLGLSFPPFPFPILAWIALVPLLLMWSERRSGRAAYIDAYAAFLVTFGVAFQWPLFHTLPMTAWLSLPALLILPMWMAAPFGLAVPVVRRLGRAPGILVLLALYLLVEFGLRRGPLAFPWTLLGHTQAEWYPINQLAAAGGVPALTLLVLAANVSILLAVEAVRNSVGPPSANRRRSSSALLSMATTVAGLAAVSVAVSHSLVQESPTSLRIGIVQPALSAESWAQIADETRVDSLMALTDEIESEVDLILWPETALPPGEPVRRRIQRWIDSTGAALLTGAISAAGERKMYNSALLYTPQEVAHEYHKRRLVPFAEHVPMQDGWPWLRRLVIPSGGVPGYVRGASNELLQIQDTRFGVLICFESLFDDVARSYANRGAALIITLTQDGWWGNSFGYRQHLAFNRLRAIETGRPMVQASVSGISAVIHPDGQISDRVGWMERAAAIVDVPQASDGTLFLRLGDWITLLAGVGTAAAVLAMIIRTEG